MRGFKTLSKQKPVWHIIQLLTSAIPLSKMYGSVSIFIAPEIPSSPLMQVPLPPAASTEARNNASMSIDSLSALEIVQLMNQEDARVAAAVATESTAIAQAVASCGWPRRNAAAKLELDHPAFLALKKSPFKTLGRYQPRIFWQKIVYV